MTRVQSMDIRASITKFAKAVCTFLFASTFAHAQLFTFPKQDLVDYTAKSPFDRLPDGRPEIAGRKISG